MVKVMSAWVPGSPHAPKKIQMEDEGASIGLQVMSQLDSLALRMKMSLM